MPSALLSPHTISQLALLYAELPGVGVSSTVHSCEEAVLPSLRRIQNICCVCE